MKWIFPLYRNYQLQIDKPKNNIINSIQYQIEKAKNDKSWISFDTVNYKKFVIDGDELIINLFSSGSNPFRGTGTIKAKFDALDSGTLINAQVIPYNYMTKAGFWFMLFFMILFSVLIMYTVPGLIKYLILIALYIIVLSIQYLVVLFNRYGLKNYLKTVLDDLGLKGDLIPKV